MRSSVFWTVSRVRPMFARIRFSSGVASSLISPFGSTARRMASARGRRSAIALARAVRSGNFPARLATLSRGLLLEPARKFSHSDATVSARDAAASSMGAVRTAAGDSSSAIHGSGSATEPKPISLPSCRYAIASAISANTESSLARSVENASASMARRPGAHVVRRRSNSRSRSNSRISSAVRDIFLEGVASAFRRACTCTRPASIYLYALAQLMVSTRMRACQSCGEILRGERGSRRLMHERIVRLAPPGCVSAFNFAHTVENRLPEIAQHDEWTALHRFFVQHFPDHGKFDQRARPALARDVTVAQTHQLEQPLLPRRHGRFLLHPAIGARLEKTGRHGQHAPARFARAARHAFHHAAVTAGADSKPGRRERAAQLHSFSVVGVALFGARASKYRNGFHFVSHESTRTSSQKPRPTKAESRMALRSSTSCTSFTSSVFPPSPSPTPPPSTQR